MVMLSADESAAFANMLKSMIGLGLLQLPWATAQVGVVGSAVGLVALAFCAAYGLKLLALCIAWERVHNDSYGRLQPAEQPAEEPEGAKRATDSLHGAWGRVAGCAFGRWGQLGVVCTLLAAQGGVGVAFIGFVADLITGYTTALSQASSTLAVWGVCCGLSLVRPLRSVAWISGAALVVYLWVLVLVFYYGAAELEQSAQPVVAFTPAGLGSWLGPSLFALAVTGTAPTIFDSMSGGRDPAPFLRVVNATYVFTVVVYAAVGCFGYVAWGAAVNDDILYSLPDGALATSAKVTIAAILLLSYPIQLAPVFDACERQLPPQHAATLWPLVRVGIVGATALLAYAVPNVLTATSLVGDVAYSLLAFILPGLIYLQLRPPPLLVMGGAPSPSREAAAATPSDAAAASGRTALPRDAFDVGMSVLLILLGVVGGIWGVIDTLE